VNTLSALEAGATRVHATALGIGERTGNTEMDLLLVNLKLSGMIENDLSKLGEYCRVASEALAIPIPPNYPVFGKDAFETATGVHAAAVIKAFKKGDSWLANRVYSGVPADLFGLEQVIAVGPMSGRSNVTWFLEKRGVKPTDEQVQRVLDLAKKTPRLLTEEEILRAGSVAIGMKPTRVLLVAAALVPLFACSRGRPRAPYWLCDDAYISFRYVRNFVEGRGLVFNPGERVEGYTNFLWGARAVGTVESLRRPPRDRLHDPLRDLHGGHGRAHGSSWL